MNRLILISALVLLLAACRVSKETFSTPDDAIVQTAYGKVRGYRNNGIYTYKGIPYARAERFMPPQKPNSWDSVRNSMAYGPVCPQVGPRVIDESEFFFHHDFGYAREDCLRLNIWSPDVNDSKKRPVMVWLHGGGFATGSSNELPSYDGESLSKKGDVVIVSLNHRLNVLGFLDLSSFGEKYKNSGNVGMLDIIEALRWIKQNIAAFGGDPDNVTIFGQSGGGRKVCGLLATPSAKGLFHKAIIESGAATEFYTPGQSRQIGELVVRELGLNASQIDSLQKIPYALLSAAGEKVLANLNKVYAEQGKKLDGFRLRWGPLAGDDIIPFQPSDERATVLMPDVPVLIGSTKNEFVTAFDSSRFIEPETINGARSILSLKYQDKTDLFIQAVQKSYPSAKRALDLLDVDVNGRSATLQVANLKARHELVYNYLFTWESPVLGGRFRSCHCLELPFVFNNISRCKEMTGGNRDAYVLADKMSRAWIAFAHSGNPDCSGLPHWEPYSGANGATMIFNDTCKLVHHHDQALLQFANGN